VVKAPCGGNSGFHTDQGVPILPIGTVESYLIEIGAAHCVLKRAGFQRSPVDYRLALGVVLDAESERLFGCFPRRKYQWATPVGLTDDPLSLDSVPARPGLPLGPKLLFALMVLGEPALMRCDLSRRRSAKSLPLQQQLDILSPLRKAHNLLPPEPLQLPAAIAAGNLDSIAKPLHFAR
jgi:hypothetical protein